MKTFKHLVDRYGKAEEVLNLYNMGKTVPEISEILRQENVTISEKAVGSWLRSIEKDTPDLLKRDEEFVEALKEKTLNVMDNMIFIQEELKAFLERQKELEASDPELWQGVRDAIALYLRHIELLQKRFAPVQDILIQNNIQINSVKMNDMLWEMITNLIDSGRIDLSGCSEEIKEMYRRRKSYVAVQK